MHNGGVNNIMSTLRNKTLVKNMEQARINLNMRNLQINGVVASTAMPVKKLVSVQSLQKITKALMILKERNQRMVKCINTLSAYYEQKYKTRLAKLRTLLNKKKQKIEQLKKNKSLEKHLMVVRHANNFFIYIDIQQISKPNSGGFSVIAYKLSLDPHVDKSVCVALAKNKFQGAAVVSSDGILFANAAVADEFEIDIKEMFKTVN
ncbi:hypothetical protein [Orgyia pseudotsugata single capsid nuclopolyhedrovirus]|nr:hypothetical protein [Orgyia pseudotsugata single capsid nuclopolyhedrovirus]